jgi:LexA-binding, inner membrane-associated putative hydrolase
MAGFRMHVTTSAVLGCGYAGVGHLYGVPLDTSIVAGAICGFSGMLPDIDSDYGVPLRESMGFTAAILPMLLVGHFQSLLLSHDAMALAAVTMYLFVRFGITNIIRKYTVHRGMFHSIPACLIFAGLAFLMCATAPTLQIRCYKAGGVVAGFMSHLILDEIYAVEWKGGRWRFKKSFGTAIKFWGDDVWSNFSTYAKLAIVLMLILGEPTVIEQLEARHPQFANRVDRLRNRFNDLNATQSAQNAFDAARDAFAPLANGAMPNGPAQQPLPPPTTVTPVDPFQLAPTDTPYRNEIDTAQRPPGYYPQ